jgi:hypothetical protein
VHLAEKFAPILTWRGAMRYICMMIDGQLTIGNSQLAISKSAKKGYFRSAAADCSFKNRKNAYV